MYVLKENKDLNLNHLLQNKHLPQAPGQVPRSIPGRPARRVSQPPHPPPRGGGGHILLTRAGSNVPHALLRLPTLVDCHASYGRLVISSRTV